jgi:hypothetical protein
VWGPARAADMLTLQIGEPRSDISLLGRPREVGAYALHIQCPWRLTEGTRIVAGSGDLYAPADPGADRETWDWDVVGPTWWDDRMQEFFRSTSLSIKVQAIMADTFGGFRLICSGDVTFEVFPSSSVAPHDVSEYWRLLQPSASAEHFVVRTTGFEA